MYLYMRTCTPLVLVYIHTHTHTCSGISSKKWKAWAILNKNKYSGIEEVGIASEFLIHTPFKHPIQHSTRTFVHVHAIHN